MLDAKEIVRDLGRALLKVLRYDDEHNFLTPYEHNQLVRLCDIAADYFVRLDLK